MVNKKELLKGLFDKWEQKHLSLDLEDFIADGIVDLAAWEGQTTPKMCFLLKEAYGERFDLTEKMKNEGAFNETWLNVAIWTQAVWDAFCEPLGAVISYNEEKYQSIKKKSKNIIHKISVINIKKSDGDNRSQFDDLRQYAVNDAEELREEINIIQPNLVICGNTWDLVKDTVFESKYKESSTIPEVYEWNDIVFINHYHSAYFTIKDEFHYYTLREVCRAVRKEYTALFAKWN